MIDVFDSRLYQIEMQEMVDAAIEKMRNEQPDFEVFTASIWTDPNAKASSINFDDKAHSDQHLRQHHEWAQRHYQKNKESIDRNGPEYVKLLLKKERRNRNPADFKLRDFVEIQNDSIKIDDWESEYEEQCWHELEPELKQIAKYTLQKIRVLKLHPQFELAVNGNRDWYQYKWKIKQ